MTMGIERLFDDIENEVMSVEYEEEDEMRDAAERLGVLATVAKRLSNIPGEHVEQAMDLHNRLSTEVSALIGTTGRARGRRAGL